MLRRSALNRALEGLEAFESKPLLAVSPCESRARTKESSHAQEEEELKLRVQQQLQLQAQQQLQQQFFLEQPNLEQQDFQKFLNSQSQLDLTADNTAQGDGLEGLTPKERRRKLRKQKLERIDLMITRIREAQEVEAQQHADNRSKLEEFRVACEELDRKLAENVAEELEKKSGEAAAKSAAAKRQPRKPSKSSVRSTGDSSSRRSSPKSAPRTLQMDSPKNSPRTLKVDSPKTAPRTLKVDSPKNSPKNAPRTLKADSPKNSPRTLKMDSPKNAPRSLQVDSPKNAPRNLQMDSPKKAPSLQLQERAAPSSQRQPAVLLPRAATPKSEGTGTPNVISPGRLEGELTPVSTEMVKLERLRQRLHREGEKKQKVIQPTDLEKLDNLVDKLGKLVARSKHTSKATDEALSGDEDVTGAYGLISAFSSWLPESLGGSSDKNESEALGGTETMSSKEEAELHREAEKAAAARLISPQLPGCLPRAAAAVPGDSISGLSAVHEGSEGALFEGLWSGAPSGAAFSMAAAYNDEYIQRERHSPSPADSYPAENTTPSGMSPPGSAVMIDGQHIRDCRENDETSSMQDFVEMFAKPWNNLQVAFGSVKGES
eukprot:TRINITY_DN9793_c0_g1_i1.p1 TRINITY_DN9793_c0_g1~~TRINITY_DN9793_c0_g1_i1.p1  ORF type:complete len:603 (-),score=145.31 TRINITY_DN9793_c0_g1_i1:183-1991(-)